MENIIGKIIAVLLVFIAPIQAVIISITIFVFVDLITGIWAALKRNEAIESKKMRDSIGKWISYCLAIILSHMLDEYFPIPVTDLFFNTMTRPKCHKRTDTLFPYTTLFRSI